ncbi:MAG: hypothetical protein WB566_09660 [Terriglobales bacterium]
MLSKLLYIVAVTVCLTPAWGKATSEFSFIGQPSTVSIVGPGTVLSVHLLDLPFIKPHYVVKYETDGGELIEVWTPGKDVLVLEGMHGILTYSTHPEKILSFRVVQQKSTK